MSSTTLILEAYNDGVEDVGAKIQQERAVHLDDLVNLYLEANLVQLPGPLLSVLESMIDNRVVFNERKTLIDAIEMDKHAAKLKDGRNQNYCRKRSLALLDNLNKKLMRDRSVHWNELVDFRNQVSGARSVHPGFQNMLSSLMGDRKQFNKRRTILDAAQRDNLEGFERDQLQQ